MLVFPGLGSQAELQRTDLQFRMSVEQHTVPRKRDNVNTFLRASPQAVPTLVLVEERLLRSFSTKLRLFFPMP